MIVYENTSQNIIEVRVYVWRDQAYIKMPGMGPLQEFVVAAGYPLKLQIGAYNNAATLRIIREPRDGQIRTPDQTP